MANLQGKLVQQGQALVYTEANTNFSNMAAALLRDKSIAMTIEQSYLSKYDVADNLRKLVKDKIDKPPADIKPLLDPNKTMTDITNSAGSYELLIAYLTNTLTPADYEPPLRPDFTSISGELNHTFPNIVAQDPRRTGRLIKPGPPDILKSTEVQKWLINNSMLYGFVLYDDNGLYYVGFDAIKAKLKASPDAQVELKNIVGSHIKSQSSLALLTTTATKVINTPPVPPATGAVGQLPASTDEFIDPLNGKTAKISSKIGRRMLNGAPQEHGGIDLGAPEGVPIYAMADGKITSATHGGTGHHCKVGEMDCGGGFGNHIRIAHVGGLDVYYAHMTDTLHTSGPHAGKDWRTPAGLKVGTNVTKGQLIGYVGNTGHSFGDHLHLEVEARPGSKYAAFNTTRFKDVNGARRTPNKKPNVINPLFVLPSSVTSLAGTSLWADGAKDNTPYFQV